MPQMAHKSMMTYTFSFTTGMVTFQMPNWQIRNDTDALAYALYLERRGKNDEAEYFLEAYLAKKKR